MLPETKSEVERVCRAVCPDLRGVELHVLAPNEAGIDLSGMGGIYSRDLGAAIGRSGCVLVVDADGSDIGWAVAVTLHELAHWLEMPQEQAAVSGAVEEVSQSAREAFEATKPSDKPRVPAALWGHGQDFHRLAAHLWWRAWRIADCWVPMEMMAFGNSYASLELLSHPSAYVAAVLSEVQENGRRPLRDILALPPPQSLVELWDADVKRIFNAALEAYHARQVAA